MSHLRRLLAMLFLSGLASMPIHAETFHSCAVVIPSIPAVISNQGVYCLTHDVNTAVTSGNAIDIQTNNVTIDCNGYKIGGLAAGTSSQTVGINATNRQNITVRNCTLRGFVEAIRLDGGAGHLVEDNRLDNNLFVAMYIAGDNNRVRRNAVFDTGGFVGSSQSVGLSIEANAVDNTVAGVFAVGTDPNTAGIIMYGDGTEARGNQVSGVVTSGAGVAGGIQANGVGVTLRDNSIAAASSTPGTGLGGHGATDTICIGNTIHKFTTAMANCQDGGGNSSN